MNDVKEFVTGAELAQQVAEYITAHPDEWDQAGWAYRYEGCGTKMCIAGTALHLNDLLIWKTHGAAYVKSYGSSSTAFERSASELLGLDRETAGTLFHGGPVTVRGVWRRFREIWGDAITIPEEYRS